MSFIGNLLSSGNGQGANYNPATVPLLQNVSGEDVTSGKAATQNSLAQQQQFLNALQAQNGIGNQSQVYNQLQGVANGTGPNPAQAMLNQATGQNVANQAALAAGQRGASSNPALIARQAAQTGANTQQQAVGQGATMQANQSLGALGQLSGIAGQQVGQQANALGTLQSNQLANQGQILGAAGQLNQQNLAQQQGINQFYGQQANTNQAFNNQVTGGAISGLAGVAGLAHGGKVESPKMYDQGGAVDSSGSQSQGIQAPSAPKINSTASSRVGQQLQNPQGGFQAGSAIGSALGNLGKGIFSSGSTDPTAGGQYGANALSAPELGSSAGFNGASNAPLFTGAGSGGAGFSLGVPGLAHGGKVDALVSPGERFLKPKEAKAVAKGKADPFKVGERIPGKAKVPGDSLKNDTVPKKLEEGGVVLPRSVISKGPAAAHEFVRAVMSRSLSRK